MQIPRDYFHIYPTSIWIPTREIDFDQACVQLNPLAKAHGFDVIVDRVTAIRSKRNEIELQEYGTSRDYDYLVLAMGSGKMHHTGTEHTLSICGAPKQSLLIRERLDALIEKGNGKIAIGFGGNPNDSSSVRGGPGFELLFNIHHLLKQRGVRENFELAFFAPMKQPGARMGPQALTMMERYFTRLDIKRHFGKKITAFAADGIVFWRQLKARQRSHDVHPCGRRPSRREKIGPAIEQVRFCSYNNHCEVDYEHVDRYFEDFDGENSPHSNVFAIGDVASMDGPD